MGDIIGEGSFGIVYVATNKKSGDLVRTKNVPNSLLVGDNIL